MSSVIKKPYVKNFVLYMRQIVKYIIWQTWSCSEKRFSSKLLLRDYAWANITRYNFRVFTCSLQLHSKLEVDSDLARSCSEKRRSSKLFLSDCTWANTIRCNFRALTCSLQLQSILEVYRGLHILFKHVKLIRYFLNLEWV